MKPDVIILNNDYHQPLRDYMDVLPEELRNGVLALRACRYLITLLKEQGLSHANIEAIMFPILRCVGPNQQYFAAVEFHTNVVDEMVDKIMGITK